MSRLVFVLNGPNLNLLGKRQPHIYGHETLADVEKSVRTLAEELQLDIRFHQSNREYEIVDWVHEARETAGGIIINPAAFTHYSVAILDALNTFDHADHGGAHLERAQARGIPAPLLRLDAGGRGYRRLGTQGYTLALRRLAFLIDEKAKIKSEPQRSSQQRPEHAAQHGAAELRAHLAPEASGDGFRGGFRQPLTPAAASQDFGKQAAALCARAGLRRAGRAGAGTGTGLPQGFGGLSPWFQGSPTRTGAGCGWAPLAGAGAEA